MQEKGFNACAWSGSFCWEEGEDRWWWWREVKFMTTSHSSSVEILSPSDLLQGGHHRFLKFCIAPLVKAYVQCFPEEEPE